MALTIGASLGGRYKVLSSLGKGGMGEVYLAHDSHLRRSVAIKVLPAAFTEDRSRLSRFAQEAHRAAKLNHPNIITLHEFAEMDGIQLIVTEYIEGETLRAQLTRRRKKVGEVIEVALQVAEAMCALHAVGIVHRDLKPENIMVRPDGYVKVLDFGLALLTARPLPVNYSDVSTAEFNRPLLKEPDDPVAAQMLPTVSPPSLGLHAGTPKYMSPEQVRGQELDARSDLFNLGVLIYEMATGRWPFGSDKRLLAAILEVTPPPLSRTVPGVPEELDWIVEKALAKDREERYQSAKDLRNDLKRLKRSLDLEAAPARLLDKQSTSRPSPGSGSRLSKTSWLILAGLILTLSAPMIVKLFGGGASMDPPLVQASYAAKRAIPAEHSPPMQITELAQDAAIHPNGNYIVYVVGEGKEQYLYIYDEANQSGRELLPKRSASYWGLTFSPDGHYLYYNLREPNPSSTLYRLPVPLGGAEAKVTSPIDSPVTFSRDGKRLAYMRRDERLGESRLIVVNEDGSEQELALRRSPERLGWPAWSPTEPVIVCPVRSRDEKGDYHQLMEFNVESGMTRVFSAERWIRAIRLAWLSDGSGIILTGSIRHQPPQIWQVTTAQGKAEQLTYDLNTYINFTLTADRRLIAVHFERLAQIWTVRWTDHLSRLRPGRPITGSGSAIFAGTSGLAWTRDGRLVYGSSLGGRHHLRIRHPENNGTHVLTSEGWMNFFPAVSPDGRYIVFTSDRKGTDALWRMEIDGSNPMPLTTSGGDYFPSFTPDGKWVVYHTNHRGRPTLMKVPIEGGDPVPISDIYAERPSVSPDGQYIACLYWDEGGASPERIAIISIDGGAPIQTFENPSPDWQIVRWTLDSEALILLQNEDGVSNLLLQPLSGAAPTKLTNYEADQIFWFDLSPDGLFAFARGNTTQSLVEMRF